ncbi:MAG: response regulator transcription factor [Prevotella sp.]|nr:response regulator transcription factor [Alistipes senegalensis]MCM1358248.1 response regulator transcription factor [Prevotella sp.]MCM1472792.1 response regulator transcription factor [Muribaculaceae bacterium]MDE6426030.1 response regulator transcription factor [Ruminococcus sp.]
MIYLLEDDSGIRSFVTYALNNSGLETESFELPSEFWSAMNEKIPELILLDIMLPEEDGLSILKKIRSDGKTAGLPVIMLTARDTEYDKVQGLDSGADDYVSKPFGIMELLSRIKALLRRTSGKNSENISLDAGNICIYPSKHEVLADGVKINLTLKEYELLLWLVKNKGEVYSRDTLLQKIWGYDFSGESRTVDVHVRTLRSKLGKSGDVIKTIRGVGYKAEGERNDRKNI